MQPRIDQLLAQAKQKIQSETAQLDAELLLAFVLNKPRSFLRTWPEKQLEAEQLERFEALLKARQEGQPVAYLIGHQGFWSLDLAVNSSTLIPRADTELLVEAALELVPEHSLQVLDLGTGTGAIALALAAERPLWSVTGVDRVAEAVSLAQQNAKRNQIHNARFITSFWFAALKQQRFDLIVSNPPYIAADDQHLTQGDVRFEPSSALVSGADGLEDIRLIIAHSVAHLNNQAWLMLEHGYDQAQSVQSLLSAAGFQQVHSRRDLAGHERISLGQWIC
ncbi:peptide chain release factor N(5)-glutamine methyltransferase [Pseudomonas sp. F1_0610]|uniref:peptide chain release factor N(5)-glutamine methyltransferase n=1 Tax=Pseudomonas sp. F1_0610 TaxID=3114284 RepID=UPI0039C38FAC